MGERIAEEKKALVGNAGDEQQVASAVGKERRIRTRELNDVRAVLATEEGRRFVWRLLEQCKAFLSVKATDDSTTNYNAGKQDIGHYVITEMLEARPNALVEMMTEAQTERTE